MKTTSMCQAIYQRKSWRSTTAVVFSLALAGLLTACGGGSSAATNTSTGSVAKTAVQVNMGDSPADWMLAFSMNITSMTLNGSNGTVSAVSSSTPMEMMHLMGTMQPLAMVSAPQGSYISATITLGSATVMYLNPTTKAAVQTTIPGPISTTVNFPTPIVVGTVPMAMGFDLNLANSVTADANNNLSMSPVFQVTSGMQGSGSPLDPSDGGIQQMMGTVSSISGSSFTMSSMQAAQAFNFATNSSTKFGNMSGMGMMSSGMLVTVDATMQPDGSLLATQVQSMMNAGGVMGGGLVTAVSGSPATQLTMVMQNGVGTGMMASSFAAGATSSMNGSTTYAIDEDGVDMAGLPFTPVFDGNHIYAGQSVMPISSSGMMSGGMSGGMMGGSALAGTITASEVELQPQGMSGTVASAINGGVSGSFTMTLATGSAFSTLTGASSVIVYQQSDTAVAGSSPIAGGSAVHVFGLLFMDSGQWKMVAARIGAE